MCTTMEVFKWLMLMFIYVNHVEYLIRESEIPFWFPPQNKKIYQLINIIIIKIYQLSLNL